jgi:NADPH:quinone reductase-like Zn-dependent oxidoreductase
MKSLQIVNRDGNRVVELKEDKAYDPSLGEDQVLVRMEAAVINGSDLMFVSGRYAVNAELPSPVGGEGVGRVEKAGRGASHLLGQRVIIPPTYEQGTWAEYIVANRRSIVEVTGDADVLQLAMLGINPPTAYLLLKNFVRLMPGDWIGQTAANGAVGEYVIQLAKLICAKTLNVVRSSEAAEQVRRLGGDEVVVLGDDLPAQIEKALKGYRLNLVLDSLGGAPVGELMKFLTYGGAAVNFGGASGQPMQVPPALTFNGLSLHGFWEVNWLRRTPYEEIQSTFKHLIGLVAAGKLHARVDATYSIDQYRQALDHVKRAGRNGKILFRLHPA